ncbi:hypothetical protein TESG_02649 [Trichophyton tonsurans CBS 112818]|uniref:Uncharacterized protein n=1 Tax=Trichophyton tonsurans (strain CBS 112818) TaxID=647933 RepID=F2RUU3_TRIT1|nr:hypothetical protein TESG_02649 [Trichophyton tonsurans CBS 112818]
MGIVDMERVALEPKVRARVGRTDRGSEELASARIASSVWMEQVTEAKCRREICYWLDRQCEAPELCMESSGRFRNRQPRPRPMHLRRTLSAASCCPPLQPPAGPVSAYCLQSEEQRLKVPKRDADSAGTSSDFRRPQICRAASSISKSPLAAHPRRSWTSHTGLVAVGRKLQTGDPAARRCLAHITGAQKSTARSAHGFYFLPIFAPAAAGTWL